MLEYDTPGACHLPPRARWAMASLLLGVVCLCPQPVAAQDRVPAVASRPRESEHRPAEAESLPLKQPKRTAAGESGGGSWTALWAWLGGAILLIVGAGSLWKRTQGPGEQRPPTAALEMLGRMPLAGRHQLCLVRCGPKLLVLCVTAAGAQTLTEIVDPDEVERLSELCRVQPAAPWARLPGAAAPASAPAPEGEGEADE